MRSSTLFIRSLVIFILLDLGAAQSSADLVNCTFKGTLDGGSGATVSGTFCYDSTCTPAQKTHVFYPGYTKDDSDNDTCQNLAHCFTYTITNFNSTITCSYIQKTPYQIAINPAYMSTAATFTLQCRTNDNNDAVLTLNYWPNCPQAPTTNALPTALSTGDFQTMTLKVYKIGTSSLVRSATLTYITSTNSVSSTQCTNCSVQALCPAPSPQTPPVVVLACPAVPVACPPSPCLRVVRQPFLARFGGFRLLRRCR